MKNDASNSKETAVAQTVAQKVDLKTLAPAVDTTLRQLKTRIRLMVLVEGVALAIVWLVGMFWISLAIDYLPVRFGFNELSAIARTVLLVIAGVAAAWLLYRYVFNRIFVALKDSSLALLIERKFPQFNESLITTVEHARKPSSQDGTGYIDHAMLKQAAGQADALCKNIAPREVLNQKHVKRVAQIAGVALVSLAVFAVVSPASARTAIDRLYLLKDKQWTRQNLIELVGLKVEYQNPVEGIDEFNTLLAEENQNSLDSPANYSDGQRVFHVAKGATLDLTVRAAVSPEKKLPAACVMHFYTTDGSSGSQTLNRIGTVIDGWQTYRLRGTPLSGMFEDLTFYLQGGDFRIGPFEIHVVDEPVVESTALACEFPDYMVDVQSGR